MLIASGMDINTERAEKKKCVGKAAARGLDGWITSLDPDQVLPASWLEEKGSLAEA